MTSPEDRRMAELSRGQETLLWFAAMFLTPALVWGVFFVVGLGNMSVAIVLLIAGIGVNGWLQWQCFKDAGPNISGMQEKMMDSFSILANLLIVVAWLAFSAFVGWGSLNLVIWMFTNHGFLKGLAFFALVAPSGTAIAFLTMKTGMRHLSETLLSEKNGWSNGWNYLVALVLFFSGAGLVVALIATAWNTGVWINGLSLYANALVLGYSLTTWGVGHISATSRKAAWEKSPWNTPEQRRAAAYGLSVQALRELEEAENLPPQKVLSPEALALQQVTEQLDKLTARLPLPPATPDRPARKDKRPED